MDASETAFTAFALLSQALLALFFAARRWWPDRAERLGVVAYGFGLLGLPLALVLLLAGAAPALAGGPLLMAAWAALGAFVDLVRPRPWRGPPVQWAVMVPFVALYFLAQMWCWWPLWNLSRPAWAAFLALFVVNTALNLQGHVAAGRTR